MLHTASDAPTATRWTGLRSAYRRWRGSGLGQLTAALEQEQVLALLGPLEGQELLDVGCGDGAWLRAAEARGARCTGLDLDQTALDEARQRSGARYLQGDAQSLPFPDASFDRVMAITLLCFLPDPVAAVAEMARVLRPGGVLVLGELGRHSSWALWRHLRGRVGSQRWRQARFWRRRELRNLVRDAGLRPGPLRGVIYYPPNATLAPLLAPLDPVLGRLHLPGAAFLALRAHKPSGDRHA